ncbi:HNH endonuclease [Halomonas sp. ISL-60]|uniref:HNH endonuclease signature motif containing protein n=1 Tax=Halomonas sp. ISL-56 TaxID=2819149 RepID=UPI001BE5C22E|nr:HNH endonuclease [Halomonas sp. ISL-56]MBT2771325.1 HNH endonuclease [Halomonas sp. ISL-60]MBT2800682.1 HNH endonuclease [Halomonas sp. ISL-56]
MTSNNKNIGNDTARERYGKLYNCSRWRKLRLQQLNKEPLCAYCILFDERYTQATVVDHVIPHKGNLELMYDPDNLQSLCKFHHDSYKQRLEKQGVNAIGCDIDGNPLSLDHHYNK